MKLSKRNRLLMGLTLFSMFFGAGNLIFPPYLAYQAGRVTWLAMAGFCISAIGLPVLGVIAVAKSGGLETLSQRVNPWFSQIFVLLAYLAIGPGLAIPRTSVTSFEMAVLPFAGNDAPVGVYQMLYSAVFFTIAVIVAMRPEKLSDRLGKIMTPILLTLIAVVLVGCIVRPDQHYGETQALYAANSTIQGFLDGYQTMDAIAALNFGFVIALNIRAKGVEDEKQIVNETVHAGWIAGVFLLIVYCALAHIGGVAGGCVEGATNGARTLTGMVSILFGPVGNAILAVIFVIACLNTCIGLLTSCSNYFHKLVPSVPYKFWLMFFAVGSLIVANADLDAILAVSVPVLGAIYPACILLITFGICHKWLKNVPSVYPVSVLLTSAVAIVYAVKGWMPAAVQNILDAVPLAKQGLPWLIPAVIGIVIGIIWDKSHHKIPQKA